MNEISIKEVENLKKECLIKIGKNLKIFRLSKDLTQSDVAFYIFSDKSLISSLERGASKNITLAILFRLCKLFNKDLEDFFK